MERQLGSAPENEAAVERLTSELEAAATAVSVKSKMLDDQNETIAELKREKEALHAELQSLVDETKRADAKFDDLKADLTVRTAAHTLQTRSDADTHTERTLCGAVWYVLCDVCAQLCGEKLSLKEETIRKLRKDNESIAVLTAQLQEKSEMIRFVDREIAALKDTVAARDRERDTAHRSALDEKDRALRTAHDALAAAQEAADRAAAQRTAEAAVAREQSTRLARELVAQRKAFERLEAENRAILQDVERKKQLARQLTQALSG
jgi:hypothetical protein